MSFNATIPQSANRILQSAAQIRANFKAIENAMRANHARLTGDPSLAGKHTFVVFRPVADPATTADQVAIYNKLVSSIPQIFFRPNNSQPTIQMTYPSVITGDDGATPPVYLDRQQSFIAGPFVVYVGRIPFPQDGDIITLSPSSTLIYASLVATNVKGAAFSIANFAATNLSVNQFTIRARPNIVLVADVFYTAIGIP